MKWIRNNWSIVLFAATVLIDYQFEILAALEHSPRLVTATRILGLVALVLVNWDRITQKIQNIKLS
jgi:hypothetical protein